MSFMKKDTYPQAPETPADRARAAYEAGDTFFQLRVDVSRVEGYSSDWNLGGRQRTQTTRNDAADLLGQVEAEGWHLEHTGYVFVETGEVSRSKMMSHGSVSRTNGYVEGIYLFRRKDR
jgi:hypothetical protein